MRILQLTQKVKNKNYLDVTEVAGEEVSREQIQRLCNRYFWAGMYCKSKKVLEVACGTGPGLGFLAKIAKEVVAGDYSHDLVEIAKLHYGERIKIHQFDAQRMPFYDCSIDVVILFEAIYYLQSASAFISECRRVLRPGGKVLLATANKDLFDFNPSPHSYNYYGVVEMRDLFRGHGFSTEFFGDTPISTVSIMQKLIRPAKKIAVTLGVVPKTMSGKKFLKRLVFGKMIPMPAEIDLGKMPPIDPVIIPSDKPDRNHKVIYCVAALVSNG